MKRGWLFGSVFGLFDAETKLIYINDLYINCFMNIYQVKFILHIMMHSYGSVDEYFGY